MRVQSPVLIHLQTPLTIFGMAPFHFVTLLVVSGLGVGAVRLFFSNAAAFGVLLFVAPVGIVWAIYVRRKDPHCETAFLLPTLFYKLQHTRTLLTGQPVHFIKQAKRGRK